MIHLNFDSEQDPLPLFHATTHGAPEVKVDPVTNRKSCFFDGKSYLQFPPLSIGKNDFSMQLMFRPTTVGEERGIFGSHGYRLALRQDPRSDSLSFWAHFPSSINQQRITLPFSAATWIENEHYFGISRVGDVFTARLDDSVLQLTYAHDYWSYIPFVGMYYDALYAYKGYIRQYRFDYEAVDMYRPINETIF